MVRPRKPCVRSLFLIPVLFLQAQVWKICMAARTKSREAEAAGALELSWHVFLGHLIKLYQTVHAIDVTLETA